MKLTGRFKIDGHDLYDEFSIFVKNASGLDVLPKVKKRDEHDWQEESGLDVDTSTEVTYEAMNITLSCIASDNTYADAVKRINSLVNILSADGYHLLYSQLRGKTYPVLLQEISDYKLLTTATASSVVLDFSVKLLCPLPELRSGSATVEAEEEVTLTIPTNKDFIIWWGDGTMDENVLKHTYTEADTYTLLIAGTGVMFANIAGTGITINSEIKQDV